MQPTTQSADITNDSTPGFAQEHFEDFSEFADAEPMGI